MNTIYLLRYYIVNKSNIIYKLLYYRVNTSVAEVTILLESSTFSNFSLSLEFFLVSF